LIRWIGAIREECTNEVAKGSGHTDLPVRDKGQLYNIAKFLAYLTTVISPTTS